MKIDSVRYSGQDTILYNYRIFNDQVNSSNCLDTADTNFFIDQIRITPYGDYLFFNALNDTILLKPYAALMEPWKLTSFKNGYFLEATVTSLNAEMVLGSMDSVKTITLQARNSSTLSEIPDIFNGKEIRISKDHGLLKFYKMFPFPGDTTLFELVGRAFPPEGITNLTEKEIFNWEIGDEFHYYARAGIPGFEEYETCIVSEKQFNADTIIYTLNKKIFRRYLMDSSNNSFEEFSEINKVSNSKWFSQPSYQFLADTKHPQSGYSIQSLDTSFPSSRIKKFYELWWVYDTCVTSPLAWCWPGIFIYKENIGLINQENYGGSYCYEKDLVYYNTTSGSWGTPLNWSLILGVENGKGPDPSEIQLYQEDGILKIYSEKKITAVECIDVLGRIENIKVENSHANQYEFSIPTRNKIIFFRITDSEQRQYIRKTVLH